MDSVKVTSLSHVCPYIDVGMCHNQKPTLSDLGPREMGHHRDIAACIGKGGAPQTFCHTALKGLHKYLRYDADLWD